jgi:hypothetical protein
VLSFAQTPYSIKGLVADTASNIKLQNATVSVLNAKDSTLFKFTRVNSAGTFGIENFKPGNFILLVTYPDYVDYVEHFKLDSTAKTRDFGKLNLFLKSRLLADVIVKGTIAAIKIKGDTTEFNAAAYKIQPNSNVEDLLKQLPGIQIDKDGKITAQGQTVTKVLVDGEEFFGDDPTLVTKNLRGDMVDKVQLFDKKSDQATFTGIDDGEKTKTLNIKLKEDKKNGYFGKVDAGGSTDDYFQGQGMFNAFKAKKKFSAYGTSANTGKTGLSWQDNNKYGSSEGVQVDVGGIYITNSGDDLESWGGNYNGQGIPLANTGGMHYDARWNNDKQTINSNYKIGSLGVTGTSNNQYQSNLPTGILNSNSDRVSDNFVFRQKLDAMYEIKLDTTSTLKFTVDGTLKNTRTNEKYLTGTFRGDNTRQNEGGRTIDNDGNQRLFNASVLWTKKLKKPGRTLSWSLTEAMNENDSKGYLNSNTSFYNTLGSLDSTRSVNQYKTSNVKSNLLNSNITYTEPITKALSVVFNYGINVNNGASDWQSFNQSASGEYDQLDAAYSNNFELNQLSNQVGAIFNYKKNKTIINVGSKVTDVHFNQHDVNSNSDFKRNFINWSPQASYQYKFSQQRSLRLGYNGYTTQPNINQIQPVRVNTDPLNITLGNPDLSPAFGNRINASYSSYKVLSSENLNFGGSYTVTFNQIVSSRTIDAGGKSTYQSINLSDKKPFGYNGYMYYGKKIKKLDFLVGLEGGVYGSTFYSYVNNLLNTQQNSNYYLNLNMGKYKEKKYSFNAYFGPNFNNSSSSISKQLNNNGVGWDGNGSLTVYLPGKLEIGTTANYQLRKKTQAFDTDLERLIINSSLSKKFLKKENLKLSVSGNDLLNQNIGINRSAFSSSSFTTIKRYYLLSLTWDFNKMGGTPPKTP